MMMHAPESIAAALSWGEWPQYRRMRLWEALWDVPWILVGWNALSQRSGS